MKLSRILFIGIVSVAAITVPSAFATRSLRQESTSASIDSEDAGVASADSLDSIDSIDAPISLIRPVEPFEPPRLGVVPLDTHHQTDSTNTFATHGDIVRQHSRELVHAFVKLRGLDPEDEVATPTVEVVPATAPPEDFETEPVKQHPIEPSHFGSRRHFKG